MKGAPPFTRHPVENESLTRTFAGLGPALRKAAANPLAKLGELILLHSGRALHLVFPQGANGLATVCLCREEYGFGKVSVRIIGKAGLIVQASGPQGKHNAIIEMLETDPALLRVRVFLRPAEALHLGEMPREVCMLRQNYEPVKEGLIYTTQTGPNAGQAYSAVGGTTLLYLQNLTSIGTCAVLGDIDLAAIVGVDWPELGMRLPAGKNPLPADREVQLYDSFFRVVKSVPVSESECALCFIEGLAAIHRHLDPPPVSWFDWAETAGKTVRDLSRSKECMRRIDGQPYLNAYVGCTEKPPESMVQGAVLVPLLEYEAWLGKPLALLKTLGHNQTKFYDKKLKSIVRWLPNCPFHKEELSDEELAGRMDSWYLIHTLMNLGRQAEFGREPERKLFRDSLAYVIRVARHFKHDWPVFFDGKTLEVHKWETAEGAGGERDVPGLYVHLMMQAWRLERDELYLSEAKDAAATLVGLGFGVLYQANNTALTAVGLARLWQETGNALYRELSYVCIGSILSHLWLWESGDPGREWETYMGLPPLHDCPYIAAYEEGEIFATFAAYQTILGRELPECIGELLAEYGKRLLHRARYYFPAELPPDAVCMEPKDGIMRPALAIPVEDLYPSSAPAGQVGQEVYGAALALILTPRAYRRWKEIPFDVWSDAPLFDAEFSTPDRQLRLRVGGSAHQEFSVRLIRREARVRMNPSLRMIVEEGSGGNKRRPLANAQNHLLYPIRGKSWLRIEW